MKTLLVIGTRPEAVKMAPVAHVLAADPRFDVRIGLTAQHRGMLDEVMGVFGLTATHDLDLMRPGQTLTHVAVRVLEGIDAILAAEPHDWVLVQGDTTTSMAAAQAAFHRGVRVGHVEAGLRTWNVHEPFPEEWNRRAIDALADLAFAPTAWARENLLAERVPAGSILVTGNTAIDALHWVLAQPRPHVPPGLEDVDPSRPLVLVTAHRRESFGAPLESVCRALAELAGRDDGRGVEIVYPVHPNPEVRRATAALLAGRRHVHLLPPLDYVSFVRLMERCRLILTDSGGIQEEAPALGKPVLVLRQRTERPEAIEAGTARLVGTDRDRIVGEVDRLLGDAEAYRTMAVARNPFGDGKAAGRIRDALVAAGAAPAEPQPEADLSL